MESVHNQIFEKRHFKEGDEVVHKENPTMKMEVRKIVRTKKEFTNDSGEKDNYSQIIGIECGWWNDREYKKEVFHTKTLVPAEVAEGGYTDIIRYLDNAKK